MWNSDFYMFVDPLPFEVTLMEADPDAIGLLTVQTYSPSSIVVTPGRIKVGVVSPVIRVS